MKTSELSGALLDYWVARARGWTVGRLGSQSRNDPIPRGFYGAGISPYGMEISKFRPSIDWSQGGPIITHKRLSILRINDQWEATVDDPVYAIEVAGTNGKGATPLIAAMRAFVAIKFGDEVPDEDNS